MNGAVDGGREGGGYVPAVTEPPGELMYKWIGFSGLSASRKRSWATTEAETSSLTSPFRQTIRSWVILAE